MLNFDTETDYSFGKQNMTIAVPVKVKQAANPTSSYGSTPQNLSINIY